MRFQRYNSRRKLTEWAYDQFDKLDIPKPEEYTADELKYLNPEIPKDFIDSHAAKRRNLRT